MTNMTLTAAENDIFLDDKEVIAVVPTQVFVNGDTTTKTCVLCINGILYNHFIISNPADKCVCTFSIIPNDDVFITFDVGMDYLADREIFDALIGVVGVDGLYNMEVSTFESLQIRIQKSFSELSKVPGYKLNEKAVIKAMCETWYKSGSFDSGTAELWFRDFGRVPMDKKVFMVGKRFIPSKKVFGTLMKIGLDNMHQDHDVIGACAIISLFQDINKSVAYAKAVTWHEGAELLSDDGSLHLYGKEEIDYIWKHKDSSKYRRAISLAKRWEDLLIAGGGAKFSVDDNFAFLRAKNYSNVISKEFAMECGKHNIGKKQFEKLQAYYLKGCKKQCNVPMVDIAIDGLRGYTLPKNDVRGMFLGEYTDCCQHPNGVGADCAYHGTEDPDGSFVVVESKGEIVAQSWTWKNEDAVVFDNIETLGNIRPGVIDIYKAMAKQYLEKGIKQVRVGGGYDDANVGEAFERCINLVDCPDFCYTDADDAQYDVLSPAFRRSYVIFHKSNEHYMTAPAFSVENACLLAEEDGCRGVFAIVMTDEEENEYLQSYGECSIPLRIRDMVS